MDELVKREAELSVRHGRKVAIRFSRNDPHTLAFLLDLFGTIQVSPFRDHPEEMVAYGQWTGPLAELDARLKQMSVVGLALIGLVEEEAGKPATAMAVQPWKVSVRFQMRNGPLFIYLTSLLASVRVMPVPYSEQLWVEGTFRGPLDVFESSLRELKAEELIVLNKGEASTRIVNAQVSRPATVPEPSKPAVALPAPASALERLEKYQQSPVTARMGSFTRSSKGVAVFLIVLIVGSVGWIVTHLESVNKFLSPHPIVAPAPVNPQTVSWSQMVHQDHFRSWLSIQQQNGWSNEQMAEFLIKLRRLKTDYFQYPSVVARSLALLDSENARTPQDFSALNQSLRLRVANGWPFPDQPPNVPLLSLSVDFNFSVLSFYEALAQQPDVLGWLLEHVGRRAS